MSDYFNFKPNLEKLRDCQREAYLAIKDYFQDSDNIEKHVLVQLPTGTGKSAVIAISPYEVSNGKVLILTPNLTLASQIENDIDIFENPSENIYKKLSLFSSDFFDNSEAYPLRLGDRVSANDIDEHQIIIANYQQLSDVEKWFKGKEHQVDLIIIDEAHHQKAKTYQEVIDFFPNAKILSLTATPFRSDGKPLDGKMIYTYHFSDAIRKEYIRNIKVCDIAPESILLVGMFNDKEGKEYSLEDILKLKEDAWFRRGIALSQDCCDSIASKSFEKLLDLRKSNPDDSHQIIAAAISKRHAREFVKPAFERLGLKVGLVSTEEKDNDSTIRKLKQGKIDVIVNIGMLGEGFDHKPLGVAAIFRPFASLNPYIQFLGRVIRENGNTKNCWVVSHLGLNQVSRFKEFRLFDAEDKEILERLLSGDNKEGGGVESSFVETQERDFLEVQISENGDSLVEFNEDYVDLSKVEKIQREIGRLNESEAVELLTRLGLSNDSISTVTTQRKRVKPINKKKAAQSTLNEKSKSIAVDILKSLNLAMYDRDFNPLRKNFVWVKAKVDREINKKLGIKPAERKNITNAQYDEFSKQGELELIKEHCLDYFKSKL
ncbi:DEAD/DEAH box helicase [Pantoea ananatis]|uniref:DEAD/DEAH box helicase n=1 Tax=Pantoea ananas TaxID=553 RepID=UPI001B312DA5|nr:DEAD/DEAH box helicase family protein [Pantoea ananatis]